VSRKPDPQMGKLLTKMLTEVEFFSQKTVEKNAARARLFKTKIPD